MVNELKNAQNKIITSIKSCRQPIKTQDKKCISFGVQLDLQSTQLTHVINVNKSLKVKVEKLEPI